MAPPGASALVDAFRKPDFNVAAFVRDATGQGQDRVSRLTQQLEDSVGTLDQELQREIVACHEELLQNAGSISSLDGQLGDIREVVEALKTSIARVRGDVLSPFEGVKRRARLLERMQAVNVLIRRLSRFLFDARKLRTQMEAEAPSKDYSKAAHTLHELESVLQESSLENVDVLRAEVTWIRECGVRVRRQAQEDLRSGMKQGNQVALSVALQVFFNLQCLWPQLDKLVAEMLEEFAQAALPAGNNFLPSLEVNLQVLMAHMQRIFVLDELLRNKTDPITHRSFSSVLETEGVSSLTAHFWAKATATFKTKVARVLQDRASRRALVADCPKVLNALSEALDKANLAGRTRTVLRAVEREALFASVAEIRNEFLAESIRRVTDPVEIMLPDRLLSSLSASGERVGGAGSPGTVGEGSIASELPTMHDLRSYVKLLVAELERCECCPDLLLREAVRNVRSSVLFFATRLEQVVDSSCIEVRCFENEERLQLRSPLPMPTAGHARNAQLFGIAHHTLGALREAVPARFQAAIVTPQVQATLQQTQAAIVSPMLGVLRRAVSTSIGLLDIELKGCRDDGSPALAAASQACNHLSRYYLSSFSSSQLLPYIKDLCVFIVRAFLSGAALVKPCTEQVRNALAQDMSMVESMLSSLDSDFGAHIRHEASVLREFKKLLFTQSLDSLDFEELTNVLPLHLLLAYLLHQLPAEVPTLPVFCGQAPSAFREATLMPLWDENPKALADFKAKIADLSDRHGFDPTASPVMAFILAQTA